eukprot:scaffold12.g8014.t1
MEVVARAAAAVIDMASPACAPCAAAPPSSAPASSASAQTSMVADTASMVAEEVQLPTLMPLMDAFESDNEADGEAEGHLRKARRVSCSEPPPAMAQACGLSPELLEVLEARGVQFLPGGVTTVEDYCRSVIGMEATEDNFYVYDLAVVQRLFEGWARLMPRVAPFYAVKCNPDAGVLATLAALGAGFDCASQAEISAVLALGVLPERVIYAHPQKPPREVRWAAANGVGLSTFDTESELQKMAQFHPSCGLLLRIRADDPSARCQLGNKYGAEMGDVPRLLEVARQLGLRLRGVSFHVGSGATNPAAFTAAIERARAVFDLAAAQGFEMDVLDIGGGFSGGAFTAAGDVDLGLVPAAVNAALAAHFPEGPGTPPVRVIAEPGRYFAEASATMACFVNGWRERHVEGQALPARDYWLTDGLYGSMNCLLYDHATLAPAALRSPLLPPADEEGGLLYPTTLFGPTCDGLDTIARDVPMPRLHAGDWVLFPRFGAYTIAGAVNFNGFDVAGAARHYIYSAPAPN